jgi:signal transduction histidine kinase
MKIIRDQINRLDYFIKEILDYSVNARTEVRKERIDFEDLIRQVKERILPLTQKKRIDVRLNEKGEFECYADRGRLEIIFNNLYSNSIKYQDPEKDLCLIEIIIDKQENETRSIYSDNGIGIEKQHLDKIFNMFYRASEKASGSGLGLYITKEAVAKLGGTISVSSVVGKGTQFEIIIPNH